MLDRPDAPLTTPLGTRTEAAQRRVFRSKVDTIRPTYGFEDVSLAPGTSTDRAGRRRARPGPVRHRAGRSRSSPRRWTRSSTPRFAGELARLGGLAVLNLEGVQTRYDDPDAVLAADRRRSGRRGPGRSSPRRTPSRSATTSSPAGSTRSMPPAPRPRSPRRRPRPDGSAPSAPSTAPTCSSSRARSRAPGTWPRSYDPLSLDEFTRFMPIPVAVGNTTNAEAAFALMEQGAAAIFVGVGPGAACTTREVLGIGVPQVTAISDVAAAREAFLAETGRYVPVVADGGMRRGGELAKAIAAGADALMLGSPLARAAEAPGRGTNWGMAAPSPTLPRGTRIAVGHRGAARADPPRAGRASPTAPRTSSGRCASRWPPSAPARSARCRPSRWSTRRRSRPRASPGSEPAERPRRRSRRGEPVRQSRAGWRSSRRWSGGSTTESPLEPALRRLYPEADDGLPLARRRLTLFLAQYWGGPTTYDEERGHPRLRMRHAPFAIGPLERDAWLRRDARRRSPSSLPRRTWPRGSRPTSSWPPRRCATATDPDRS